MCPHGFTNADHCSLCVMTPTTMTDLMVTPESIDSYLKENPPPAFSEFLENNINEEIQEAGIPEQPAFDGHKVWDCKLCDGAGYIVTDDMIDVAEEGEDCPCQCHVVANEEVEPETPKTPKQILNEMIERGEAKRVDTRFTPGSTIHKEPCPYCGQVAIEESRKTEGHKVEITLACGHTIEKLQVVVFDEKSYEALESLTKKKPYHFQAAGASFLDRCNGRGLIADEMGLGKTIQALIWLKKHPEAWPFIIVTKASLKVNWYREILEWLGVPLIQIIDASNELPIPGMFVGYIVSVDTIGRADWVEDFEEHDFIKTVVLDECQTIKNMNAKRTKAVRNLCQGKEHIIGLSGTPIKNNAAEYFPVLNILRPEKFYGYLPFITSWVDVFHDGYTRKVGGIRPDRLDEWNDLTSGFIIRRKRAEVLPDLPKIQRSFQYHDLGKEVQRSYTQAFEDFMSASEDGGPGGWSNTLAAMSRMRHLTGIAKIDPCVEYVTDFLLNNPDKKICIFAHHTGDVIPTVGMKLNAVLTLNNLDPCEYITGQTPSNLRQDIIDEFKNNPKRKVLILSTLAAGEGLNLQFVEDCVMLERQWNPANEEQAEGRFSRIGSISASINAVYLVAIDTIDEFFARLVEQKRSFMASTLDGEKYQWDETSLMKELAQNLRDSGRKPWMVKDKIKH